MEIERIRKELNQLLENIAEHSSKFSDERPIPSLEISFVLAKINRMQEKFSVLKHLLEQQEINSKQYTIAEIQSTSKEAEDEDQLREESVNSEEIIEPEKEASITLSDNLSQTPIPKLIDALTLNDRYLYANELFAKDMSAFNEMIKSIDNCSSIMEAKDLINPLNWDAENDHVLSFNNLVERRFI